jgi:F0F1-type ATP synthase membrane subunit b/b'
MTAAIHANDNIDWMIIEAQRLVRETHDMQKKYHVKTTKAAVKRSEIVWNSLKRHKHAV